jgi:hypothetical protein
MITREDLEMKRKTLVSVLSVTILALGSGGAWTQEQKPIDCATAEVDIAHLQHEKKSTGERMLLGVTSIMPIGLVLNTAAGTEQQNKEIATGDYNKKIEARIAEIKRACGIE